MRRALEHRTIELAAKRQAHDVTRKELDELRRKYHAVSAAHLKLLKEKYKIKQLHIPVPVLGSRRSYIETSGRTVNPELLN